MQKPCMTFIAYILYIYQAPRLTLSLALSFSSIASKSFSFVSSMVFKESASCNHINSKYITERATNFLKKNANIDKKLKEVTKEETNFLFCF